MSKNIITAFLVVILSAANVMACTVFNVTAGDGTVITSRTMEFGYDVESKVAVVPRGRTFASPAPDNSQGLTWQGKYTFVGIDAFDDSDAVFDGMNEAGLAFSALWYDSTMQWPTVPRGGNAKALAHMFLGSWVLSNFSSVDQVKAALKDVEIYGLYIPQMKQVPPMHFAVYDASGKCVVVEFDNGRVNVYDNPLGVMTNAPEFPWHLTNLRNYIAMQPEQPPAADYAGVQLKPMGHGSGMIGLPGDITPPGRFVKIAVLTQFADRPKDAAGALKLCRHIMNNVDIPKGLAIDRDASGKEIYSEWTQWTTFRDLKNKVFYFTTYDNAAMRMIDLTKVDPLQAAAYNMAAGQEQVTDLTAR
ncbi:MAG: choloylglycine hydrolase family protein [Candidatus Saganbacteria bacterium]|nr:choloylglycine hydrolase family protein [Candidatus Saganbacteria bacterium]